MSGLPTRLADFIELSQSMEDRSDRISLLIDTADRFAEVPPEVAQRPFSKTNLTPGCESEAYVWATENGDGSLTFHFAVENPQGISAKAMAVILGETLSGAPASEISQVTGDVVYAIFGSELSMGKSMGLMGMVAMVQRFAKHFASD